MFFGCAKYHSVSAILLQLQLPGFCTIILNLQYAFNVRWNLCHNNVVCIVEVFFDFIMQHLLV